MYMYIHSTITMYIILLRSQHWPYYNFLDGGFGKLQPCNVIPLNWSTVLHNLDIYM